MFYLTHKYFKEWNISKIIDLIPNTKNTIQILKQYWKNKLFVREYFLKSFFKII